MSQLKTLNTWFMAAMVAGTTMLSANASDDYKIKTKVVDRTTGASLKTKEKGTYTLGGWRHVKELKIVARGPHAKFKAVVNGMEHTPVYIPGATPYYSVAVNQAIRAFDLFNDGDLDCTLDRITMDYVDHAIGFGGRIFRGSVPIVEVREILQAVDALAYYVSLEENQQFLQPIKVLAGRALAMTAGRGEYSSRTSASILAMIAQIDFATLFLEERMKVGATYEWAVILTGHKERLADMLD